MSIFYGIKGNYVDVTDKVLSNYVVNENIVIPNGDESRARIFGDHVYGQLKHVLVKKNNIDYIYPHYQEITLPVSMFKQYWVIIVTCLLQKNYDIRKQQYQRAIPLIINRCKGYNIVIVENNGKRSTFLDDFGVPVLYTNNNFIPVWNQGIKEQLDIIDCINHFKIPDNDFIVKHTGRYFIDTICPFFDIVDTKKYDCVIRYGHYRENPRDRHGDCILGLIGMLCKYVKKIKIPSTESLELNWAETSLEIPNTYIIQRLGIYIAPGSNDFFLV